MSEEKIYIESPKYEFFRDFSGLGNPLILLLIVYLFFGWKIFIDALIGLLFIEIVGNVIKLTFFKSRPNDQKYSNLYEKSLASSFPSLHVARIAYILFLTLNVFSTANIIDAIVIFLLVAYSRIFLKKHFLIDLLGGVLLAFITMILL